MMVTPRERGGIMLTRYMRCIEIIQRMASEYFCENGLPNSWFSLLRLNGIEAMLERVRWNEASIFNGKLFIDRFR